MKTSVRILATLLALLTLLAIPLPVTAAPSTEGSDYRTYLRSLGFPESYVDDLYELHLLHPTWSFEPLLVTELNSKYTWDYVLHMETEDNVKRSLISSGSAYTAYRHKTNTTLYDSGWYQASAEAVEYFMDPRNFLNEKDIFQFEDLSFRDTVTVEQIETSLVGTFMAGKTLENGKTYAEYFLEVGRELGINPLHLASRARQEQGLVGTSSQISGLGGDKLWYYYSNNIQTENGAIVYAPASGHTESELKDYNGLYNFYNINAAGTGRFAILLGALQEAQTGTAAMADKWGGSPSWDTRWKSIYGGAYKLAKSYISNYQNTLYLQKWNVDARSKSSSGSSRNFWGQYMQNVGAALSEARNSYNALAENDCLDCAYTFLIPVYKGMPESCPDPAGGNCEFYAVSDAKYSSRNALTITTGIPQAENTYVSTQTMHYSGNSLNIIGYSLHSSAPEAYEYSLDGGAWQSMQGKHENTLIISDPKFAACEDASVPYYFSATIPANRLTAGEHTILVRGRVRFDAADTTLNNCRYYLIAEMTVDVRGSTASIIIEDIAKTKYDGVDLGATYTLPVATASSDADTYFAGWLVTGESSDKSFLPAGADITVTENLTLTPIYIFIQMRPGAAIKISPTSALRFCAALDYDGYTALVGAAGQNKVEHGMIICQTPASGLTTLHPDSLALSSISYKKTVATEWCQRADSSGEYYGFFGDSAAIGEKDYETTYSATAYVRVTYSNGASAYICAAYDADTAARSVKEVAETALQYSRNKYTDVERAVLGSMLGK
ncbi:MAG: hypothetical protein IJY27_04570 [Clostridia bacterium]|nr:hypothetical protein [Clostridia bacterium]